MATQFGFQCWCSDDTDLDYSRHSANIDGLCTMACEGDTVSNKHKTPQTENRWKKTPRARTYRCCVMLVYSVLA